MKESQAGYVWRCGNKCGGVAASEAEVWYRYGGGGPAVCVTTDLNSPFGICGGNY